MGTSCSDCAAGRFAAGAGAEGCQLASRGSFVAADRAAAQEQCAPGRYADETVRALLACLTSALLISNWLVNAGIHWVQAVRSR